MSTSSPESSEQFTERQFYDFLNGAGNHELKLMTGALVLSDPDTVHTAASLRRAVIDRQGEPTVWNVQASILSSYILQSLEPSGAVNSLSVLGERGKIVTGYRAAPNHRAEKLSLTGSLLSWSLDNPDISLQQVFGITSSNSELRSPEMRHRIFTTILSAAEAKSVPQLHQELQEVNYGFRQGLELQLERMKELGLVELRSNTGHDPKVQILNTEFEHLSKTLEGTLPETRAIYAALGKIGQRKTATINQIVSVALSLDPTIDPTLARQKLLNSVVTKGYPGLKIIETDQEFRSLASRTIVKLGALAARPVIDLCERLNDARENDPTQNIDLAKRIIASPSDFRALIIKTRRFSPAVVASDTGLESLKQQLVDIVKTSGEVTASEARNALRDQHAREISSRRVNAVLSQLVEDGSLEQDVIYKNPHSKKSTRTFKSA